MEEVGFLVMQGEHQHPSTHHQTPILGLEMRWAGEVVGQVELYPALAKVEMDARTTYKQQALAVLSGQLLVLAGEQIVLCEISKLIVLDANRVLTTQKRTRHAHSHDILRNPIKSHVGF